MKKYTRFRLSLTISILILSIVVPTSMVNSALSVPGTDAGATVNVGDTLNVWGSPGDVTSSSIINVYWDIASGSGAWLLNTTTGNPDGSYSLEITVPFTENGTHYIWVRDTATDETARSDGISVLLNEGVLYLSKDSGPVGSKVSISVAGLESSETYNLSFGDILLIDNITVDIGEDGISQVFYVPSIASGVNQLALESGTGVVDSKSFDVTEQASITLSHPSAPNGFNIYIFGDNFPEINDVEMTWTIFNSSWSMDIAHAVNTSGADWWAPVTTSQNGSFTGRYIIPHELSIGLYTLKCTAYPPSNYIDAFVTAETLLNIGSETMKIGTILDSYYPGDTMAFTINTTFAKEDSYLTISDPNNYPYWTSTFTANDWFSVGDFMVVPFNSQIDDVGGVAFTLPTGALNGLWSWVLKSNVHEVIAVGNFSVVDEGAETQLAEFNLSVSAGWNMVSIPFLPSDPSVSSVLGGVEYYQLVTWSGTGYVESSEFELGKGYWLLVLEGTSITITE